LHGCENLAEVFEGEEADFLKTFFVEFPFCLEDAEYAEGDVAVAGFDDAFKFEVPEFAG
jgi:hypothetical protein